MKRTLFPVLMNKAERRSLGKLSRRAKCSQAAIVRQLIKQEAHFGLLCRRLITRLVRKKSYPHRTLLLTEIRQFVKEHGSIPQLEKLLPKEHGQ